MAKKDASTPPRTSSLKRNVTHPLRDMIERKVLPITTKVTDMWTSTAFFKNLVKKVFDRADLDSNGVLSEAELFVCILRVYDEVNFRLPTYVRPPSRKMVQALLKKNDRDKDGAANFEEFLAIMRQLLGICSLDYSVLIHIVIILLLRMLILPAIAALITGGAKWVGGWAGIARFVPGAVFVIVLELLVKQLWAQTFAD